MSMRKILNRVSMKTLSRICSVAIVIPAFTTAEFWVWQNARKVFDGHTEAMYWFAPDGTATYALNYAQKNWSSVPVSSVYWYGNQHATPDTMAWYDEHGNKLDWKATKIAEPSFWRYDAQLRKPIGRGEWTRYTLWVRDLHLQTARLEGQSSVFYQEDNGDWFLRDISIPGPENSVTMVFPANTEIITVEPRKRATVHSGGGCPMVRFDDLREPHAVRWRLRDKPPGNDK